MNQKSGLDFEVYVQAIFEDREIPVFETLQPMILAQI